MTGFTQFSAIATSEKVDAENGIIRGVCAMSKGEAKGHGLMLDDKSIDGFLGLCQARKDGVKVRFGADHDAGASDINGTLKNFRREGDKIRADLHLLKSDKNFSKIIEMAEKLPNEFGLSASTSATEELIGHDRYVRFSEVNSVDIVSNPATTKGLFFSATNNQPNTIMIKEFALMLGLPDTATEAEVKLALEAKCKMDAESKKKLDAENKEKKEKEEGGGESKKFAADLEAVKLELAAIKATEATAKAAAHKAEVEALKLEAGKDGKVIPLGDAALLNLSVPDIKDMIAKLPKGQVKLSRGTQLPVSKDGTKLPKNSPEFKAYLAEKRESGALALGQRMTSQTNLN